MERAVATDRWALVLAGGDGRRLQELTRRIAGAPIPKQYCRLLGERSLLEATLLRTHRFAPGERTLVIVNRDHLHLAEDQLSFLPPHSILIQPRNCDTGPGLLFGLVHLARRHPSATVAVFPSDHYIGDDRAFVRHVERAADIATEFPDKIVLLGIQPDRSDAGYGYLQPTQPLMSARGAGLAFHVAEFCEKPSVALARSLRARGGLWNSFVMVFQVERMLRLVRLTMPAELEEMAGLPDDPAAAAARYGELKSWSFSSTFLARIPQHLVVLPVADVRWSDWGTQQAIERTLKMLKQQPPWRSRRLAPAAA